MALRFLLGAAEAGFGPGVPFLLSFFFLRREVGLRVGLFLSAAPLANSFAGALAYGITSGHSELANWRLLFLVEGYVFIAFLLVAFVLSVCGIACSGCDSRQALQLEHCLKVEILTSGPKASYLNYGSGCLLLSARFSRSSPFPDPRGKRHCKSKGFSTSWACREARR